MPFVLLILAVMRDDTVTGIGAKRRGEAKDIIGNLKLEQKKLDTMEYSGFPCLEIAAQVQDGKVSLYAKRKSLEVLPVAPVLGGIYK